uniref:TonB family protein n=1 Tax=Prevotella sp. TaxID=59823 RepID=UPI0040298C11
MNGSPSASATVTATVALDASGTVVSSSGAVKTSDDPLFDKEALRVVKLMPRFVPDGEGKVVSGSVEIPVMFRLK